jgi:hypothetical protein
MMIQAIKDGLRSKKTTFATLGAVFMLLLQTIQVEAQRKYRDNTEGYLAIMGSIGIMNYFGDLNPTSNYLSTDIGYTRWGGIGVNVSRKMSPNFHLRLGFVYGRIQADDFSAADPGDERARYRYIRNASFRNDIYELSLTTTFDILANSGPYYRRRLVTPYLMAGISVLYHNPQARTPENFGGQWVDLRPLGTEGQGRPGYQTRYSNFTIAIPFGAGVRFRVTDRLDIGGELGIRYTFTDYLDDVGGNYADPGDLGSDLARAMANRTLEPNSVMSSGSRAAEIARLSGIIGTNTVIGSDGNPYPTFAGYGARGDKRGQDNTNDVFAVTSVYASYIINVGLKCPRFK